LWRKDSRIENPRVSKIEKLRRGFENYFQKKEEMLKKILWKNGGNLVFFTAKGAKKIAKDAENLRTDYKSARAIIEI